MRIVVDPLAVFPFPRHVRKFSQKIFAPSSNGAPKACQRKHFPDALFPFIGSFDRSRESDL